MQVQKNEVREIILDVAEQEFLKKGFKSASMRTIAKKAHTTLGNVYNYFQSKETILDEIVRAVPAAIDEMMERHKVAQETYSMVIDRATEKELKIKMDEGLDKVCPFDLLLSKPFVILMEGCKETKYENYREKLYDLCEEHMREHLGGRENNLLAKTIAHSFIAAVLFIAKNKTSIEEGKRELLNYIEMMIWGLIKK